MSPRVRADRRIRRERFLPILRARAAALATAADELHSAKSPVNTYKYDSI